MSNQKVVERFDLNYDQNKHRSEAKKIHSKYGLGEGGNVSKILSSDQVESLLKDLKDIGATGTFNVKDIKDWERVHVTLTDNGFTAKKYEKGGKIGADFSADTDSWFDKVASTDRLRRNEKVIEAVEITEKEATRDNLEKLRSTIKEIPYSRDIHSAIDGQIKKILDGKYNDEFRYNFGGRKDGRGRVSAASDFFSMFEQAATYGEFAKGGNMPGYISDLNYFRGHIDRIADESANEGKEYTITIELNKQAIKIPFNADSYERLSKFIHDEIKEAKDLGRKNEASMAKGGMVGFLNKKITLW